MTISAPNPPGTFDSDYALLDRYRLNEGRIYLTGTQALVRIPLMQRRLDEAAGLNTAGFISGYRGSPLAGLDRELGRVDKMLKEHHIHFQTGLNEDLAATAVWGSQQLDAFGGKKYDGVFGLWYGKGPGLDRSADAMRHANAFGTAKHGGVLAVVGDDHGAQSSTIPHQSDHMFMGFMMPILHPANVAEYLWLGLAGIAMSRFSGCWVGFKALTEIVESGASVKLDPEAYQFILPEPGEYERPPKFDLNFDPSLPWPQERWELERLVQRYRTRAAWAFARKNNLDSITLDSQKARIGILTTGKSYHDLMQALADLDIDERAAQRIGLRIGKVSMPWPLEPEFSKKFVEGLEEIIIIEEKREVMEPQVKWQLFNLPADKRPTIIGKEDENGEVWLPCDDELSPRLIARLLASRLRLHHLEGDIDEQLASYEARKFSPPPEPAPISRSPYFCSGCPHNTSTNVPDGSDAMGGIGCHIMALSMDRHNTLFTHMGGEGVSWVGMAPFLEKDHIFQNLGDGTYEHSGLLAIRQAVHAGVNITYKILFNDAVAMTGGQAIDKHLSVPAIIAQVRAEGVKTVAVLGEETPGEARKRYGYSVSLPPGVTIHHRDDLDAIQKNLRDEKGVTVLIFDQTCAAEKRRRRKRGEMIDPPVRVFINDLVCEGCGDCSDQSNCISVEPLATEFGQKRTINQSSCNKDLSCIKGFCPSFVTVHGGTLRKKPFPIPEAKEQELLSALPHPTQRTIGHHTYNILVAGIGGTGVVTISSLLSMAAHLEGRGVTALDFTGLAQKNGAVVSHLKIGRKPKDMHAVRVGKAETDLLIGCDMVVAGSADVLARTASLRTRALVNTHVSPTADFVMDTTSDLPDQRTVKAIAQAVGQNHLEAFDATRVATDLFGDAIATNLLLLGATFQRGFIPLSSASIERAIELNGVAVNQNIRVFRWGRLLAHDRGLLARLLATSDGALAVDQNIDDIIRRRADFLVAYQNDAYANRYRAVMRDVRRKEDTLTPHNDELSTAVARNYFKLLAYKDEYEVARLHTNTGFEEKIREQMDGDISLSYHMAPPIFGFKDSKGRPRKTEFSERFMKPALSFLARFKSLRGSWADPFGYTKERREERKLIAEYEELIGHILSQLTAQNYATAVSLAKVPSLIKGFGHVKAANIEKAQARRESLLQDFDTPQPLKSAAE